jgi:hypothetical protein
MARLRGTRTAVRVLIAAISLLAVLGGVAYATIPDSNGQIEGCYNPANAKSPYALSIVDNPADCAAPAVLLLFNKTGPTGSTGPVGPTGGIAPEAGSTSTRTVIVRPGGDALINSLQQTLGARGDTAYNFTLSAHNASKRDAVTLTARVIVDGKPEEGSFRQTIPRGAYATVAGLLKCDGMPAGLHRAALRVSVTGGQASVQTSTLVAQDAEALATP